MISIDPSIILPLRLFHWIFHEFIPGPDIAKTLSVSKNWNEIILKSIPLKKKMVLSSKVTIGPKHWALFGPIGNIPPLPDDIKEILDEKCLYFPKSKRNKTSKLVLIPEKIGNENFSIPALKIAIQAKKELKLPNFAETENSDVIKETNSQDAPYWAIITLTTPLEPRSSNQLPVRENFTSATYSKNPNIANRIEALIFLLFKQINKQQIISKKSSLCTSSKYKFLFRDNVVNSIFSASCYTKLSKIFTTSIIQKSSSYKVIAVQRLDKEKK